MKLTTTLKGVKWVVCLSERKVYLLMFCFTCLSLSAHAMARPQKKPVMLRLPAGELRVPIRTRMHTRTAHARICVYAHTSTCAKCLRIQIQAHTTHARRQSRTHQRTFARMNVWGAHHTMYTHSRSPSHACRHAFLNAHERTHSHAQTRAHTRTHSCVLTPHNRVGELTFFLFSLYSNNGRAKDLTEHFAALRLRLAFPIVDHTQ